MNAEEIKQAVEFGLTVCWSNDGYEVIKGAVEGSFLICFKANNSCIGLTWADGKTLNGKEEEFYIKLTDAKADELIEKMKEFLPKRISLCYTDHSDNFDGSPEELQRVLREGNLDPLYEVIDEWVMEAESEGVQEALSELRKTLARNGWPAVDFLVEKLEDELRELIFERNDATPVSDMLRHTDDPVIFYDTGYEMAPDSWSWSPARVRLERIKIKKHLGLTTGWNNKQIDEMICHASYGGQLVIYFRDDVENFLLPEDGKDYTSITFDKMCLAIIDTCGGSGFDVKCAGPVKMKFNREQLFVDKTIKYNYTYQVCGMYSSWCESTTVELGFDEVEALPNNSTLAAEVERDKHFAEVFKQGKCSFGDMDIRRHRGVFYKNEVPCGQHCPHCGTFWID